MLNLSKSCKISKAISVTAGAAGSTDIEGTIIDMQGFESICFIITLGAITSGAVTSAKVQQDDANAAGGMADLAGTSITIADDDDEEVIYLDVIKPSKRYVRLYIDRATQNAAMTANAVQYGALKEPVTHGTGVSGETTIEPAEGTA